MRLNMTLQQMASVMHGRLISTDPQMKVQALVTDSRVVGNGDVFIALKGQKFDARQFIPDVLARGAAAVIAEEDGFTVPAGSQASFILVKQALPALQELAKYHRLHSTLKVAAITGSNGKSTTKQMLRAICQTCGETVANMGNFNNQFGVPFSLLEIQPKHHYGVFELGASHVGDIREIASLAVPDVAVITTVSPAHLEFFKDLETVYKTKTEIVDCLNKGGTLVYNADNEYLARLNTEFTGKRISFGFKAGADVQVLETEIFSFIYQKKAYVFQLHLERHNKLNAAAAVAAALALGIDMEHIQKGLLTFTPMPMRLERITKNGVSFILDCYNANPASMENALVILGHEPQHPRVAVLGDMKELGASSQKYHQAVAQQLVDNGIEVAFLAGPEMKAAYEVLQKAAGIHVYYAPQAQEWTAELKKQLAQGGTCLLKASRSMNFETIFKEL